MILPQETARRYVSRFIQPLLGSISPTIFHLSLLWLLALPATLPLIQPTLTHSADGLLHLYRLLTLEQAIRQAVFFPRWFPDLAFGYGFPLFVFYAPLSYYLTLALSLPGLGLIGGFNASLILSFLLAAAGVYLLAKDIFGPQAGVLAGVAYVYAPFVLLNSLARGGLPAAWAMAAFPWVFWMFRRLIHQGAVRSPHREPLVPLAALFFGSALLMHNTLSLLFVPLLGLFLILELLRKRPDPKRLLSTLSGAGQVGLALFLGLGLAAFFLLPAIAEKQFAQVERVIISPDFDFRYHFVTLRDLLALPQPANTGLLNPQFPLTLGLAQVALAAVGWVVLILSPRWTGTSEKRPPGRGPVIAFTTLALLGAIVMMLPLSLPIWERLPLLAFVQFPHRLLGPAALLLALLAGAAVVALPERARVGFIAGATLLIITTTLPLLYPRYADALPAEPTLADMMAYEKANGAIGTTSFGEYLPIWVKQIPRGSPLEPAYNAGEMVARLDPTTLPPGTVIEAARYGFNEVEMTINAPQPFQVIFSTFYFPGWQVELDGQAGQLAPVTELGLIGVSLPEGRHHLHLSFRETLLRRVANGLSLLSAAVILIFFVANLYPARSLDKPDPAPAATPPTFFSPSQLAALAGLAILLVLVKLLYLDRWDNPWKHGFDGTTVTTAGVPVQINFGDQINLLGYDLPASSRLPGQTFALTLYWQARQPLSTNYSSLAQLVDAEAHLYAGQDNLHPGALPAGRWQPWGFVQDPHHVPVPFGTPPGNYFLVTGLYHPETWRRLPLFSGGEPGWPDVVAIPVRVARAAQPPSLAQLDIAWPLEVDFGPELRLLGASPEREVILPNDFLRLALFWEAKTAPGQNYRVHLRLLAPGDEVILQEVNQPSHNRYPTSLWQAGERVRDNQAFWIPPDFPAGTYRLQVQLLDETGRALEDWVELGSLTTRP